jgi:hypothetical protein
MQQKTQENGQENSEQMSERGRNSIIDDNLSDIGSVVSDNTRSKIWRRTQMLEAGKIFTDKFETESDLGISTPHNLEQRFN